MPRAPRHRVVGSSPKFTWKTLAGPHGLRAIGRRYRQASSAAARRAAGQPHRGSYACQRLVRRRARGSSSRIASEPHQAEAGRDRRRRAAARARGHTIQRVRIARVTGRIELTVSYGLNAHSAILDFARTKAPASFTGSPGTRVLIGDVAGQRQRAPSGWFCRPWVSSYPSRSSARVQRPRLGPIREAPVQFFGPASPPPD